MCFAAAESFHHHSCSTTFVFVFSILYWNDLFSKRLFYLFTETHKPPHPSRGETFHGFVFVAVFLINRSGQYYLLTLLFALCQCWSLNGIQFYYQLFSDTFLKA